MNASRFDAWTRRRCATLAAGAVMSLLGLPGVRTSARHKKGRKRCEKLGTRCNPRNDRKVCCGALACGIVPELGAHHCCRQRYAMCVRDADCCYNLRCVEGDLRFCDIAAAGM